jgi:CheY-like chemotaxis protein
MSEFKKSPRFKKVMVIDDTPVDRYIAERCMLKYQFAEKVILMESSVGALNFLAALNDKPEELPELILLDIRMPQMDGFGFLERFADLSDSVKKNCNIMMLSSSANPLDKERAMANPYVIRFLVKPLTSELLAQLANRNDDIRVVG